MWPDELQPQEPATQVERRREARVRAHDQQVGTRIDRAFGEHRAKRPVPGNGTRGGHHASSFTAPASADGAPCLRGAVVTENQRLACGILTHTQRTYPFAGVSSSVETPTDRAGGPLTRNAFVRSRRCSSTSTRPPLKHVPNLLAAA